MKELKNLSVLLVIVLVFTGWKNKSLKIVDLNRKVYKAEYALGFEIKGAEGKKTVSIALQEIDDGKITYADASRIRNR
mgnify:CR=1 FL=1